MGPLNRSLASLIDDLRESRSQMGTLENRGEHGELQTLESHGAMQTPPSPLSQSPGAPHQPARDEVLNYLGRLADDYHLPRKLVYASASAESGLDVDKVSRNFAQDKHHRPVKDKHGNAVVKSVDYGLMQINSSRINHDVVKNSAGHKMKITDTVEKDWKANAEVGVAVLKHAYDLVSLSEPPGAGAEDIALATYSVYNHGASHWHKFLEKDKNGVPKDGGLRNFYSRYNSASSR